MFCPGGDPRARARQVMSTRVEDVMHRTPRTCASMEKAIDAMQARRALCPRSRTRLLAALPAPHAPLRFAGVCQGAPGPWRTRAQALQPVHERAPL
jgi:hypothetical protein